MLYCIDRTVKIAVLHPTRGQKKSPNIYFGLNPHQGEVEETLIEYQQRLQHSMRLY
ncbi:hypothetical protein HNR39_001920 [Glaciimonas immobilis]|uniref:Uncharacterized protein n=1 Tax=Glaciimonas immobilis TaxID=728004 RepID=A0A840RQQ0_9BURK|nr:hypothetical protein [Glaciimonas immobilis]